HVPTRTDDIPVRLGPTVPNTPGYGPSKMSRAVYTDPVQFEMERERVLNRTWLIAGRSEQIPEAGDWISFESHGETVVVTRQPDGGLAAFHNVCMHRGPSFVTEWKGCGAKKFTCQYHGWMYDTTGKVIGVPERVDFDQAMLKDLRAPKVAADEWGGWLWVNLAGDEATPLLEWIGEDLLKDLGQFRMEEMRVLEVHEWDVPVSYKAVVDGFNEVYHASYLHTPSHEGWTKSSRNLTMHVVNDHNFMCFVPRPEYTEEIAEDPDHFKYAICHYVVFPNTVFNCNPQHIQVFNPIPIDVDRTRFLCWELVYQGDDNDPEYAATKARQQQHWERLKGVVGEDIAIYEQLKRTKRSSAYKENILSEREFKLAMYHENMAKMIQD
ncbi:MAG TPA: aromatic ring-hydroxylating dioxygenase subunit alpha, partial [Ilumatobacteraceae bacterium]|nr:aromatic ring-hydroxylating dioxygenase subunit alpha [Ilumatobacteraceae bacterium]